MKNQSLPVNHQGQLYQCEKGILLDDPFEGEIFTFWLQFFGGLSDADKKALWEVKRPQLVSVDYSMGDFGPITVQKGMLFMKVITFVQISYRTGYWFSSHETWKALQMPYYDIDVVRSVLRRFSQNSKATCSPIFTQSCVQECRTGPDLQFGCNKEARHVRFHQQHH